MIGEVATIARDSLRNAMCSPIEVPLFAARYSWTSVTDISMRQRTIGDANHAAEQSNTAIAHAPNTPFQRSNRQPNNAASTGVTRRAARLDMANPKFARNNAPTRPSNVVPRRLLLLL